MEYTILSNEKINWRAQGNLKIVENVKNIINTSKYEVAYKRKFGIDTSIVDLPFSKAKPKIIASVAEQIKLYEPRATVKTIDVSLASNEGDFIVKVVVDID